MKVEELCNCQYDAIFVNEVSADNVIGNIKELPQMKL